MLPSQNENMCAKARACVTIINARQHNCGKIIQKSCEETNRTRAAVHNNDREFINSGKKQSTKIINS